MKSALDLWNEVYGSIYGIAKKYLTEEEFKDLFYGHVDPYVEPETKDKKPDKNDQEPLEDVPF